MARKSKPPPPALLDLSNLLPHRGQLALAASVRANKVTVHAAGRRWGKSTSRKLVMLDRMMRSNGFTEGCIGAHSHAAAKDMWEADLREFEPWIVDQANEDQRRFLEWTDGIQDAESKALGFQMKGCRIHYPSLGDDHQTFQSHGLAWAIMDEMALTGNGAWDDTIRPMLSDMGGPALLYGNAYPEGKNFAEFYEIWQRGNPANHLPCGDPLCGAPHRSPGYASSSGASWENPFGAIAEEARQQYSEMVARGQVAKARCLYLGEFCTDLGSVFTNLDAVFVLKATQVERGLWIYRDARQTESVVIGIDFGKHDDKTVVVVFSQQTMEMLALQVIDRVDYLVQLPIIDRLIKRFPNRQIWSEGREETAAELLRRMHGSAVNLVKLTSGGKFDKGALVERGMDYCQRAAWRFIDVPWLKEEFRLFERTKTPKGRTEYNAPNGKHDDGVLAVLHCAYGLPLLPTVLPARREFRAEKDPYAWIKRQMEPQEPRRQNVFTVRR